MFLYFSFLNTFSLYSTYLFNRLNDKKNVYEYYLNNTYNIRQKTFINILTNQYYIQATINNFCKAQSFFATYLYQYESCFFFLIENIGLINFL